MFSVYFPLGSIWIFILYFTYRLSSIPHTSSKELFVERTFNKKSLSRCIPAGAKASAQGLLAIAARRKSGSFSSSSAQKIMISFSSFSDFSDIVLPKLHDRLSFIHASHNVILTKGSIHSPFNNNSYFVEKHFSKKTKSMIEHRTSIDISEVQSSGTAPCIAPGLNRSISKTKSRSPRSSSAA